MKLDEQNDYRQLIKQQQYVWVFIPTLLSQSGKPQETLNMKYSSQSTDDKSDHGNHLLLFPILNIVNIVN